MCLEKRCVTGVFISIVILFLLTACNSSILNEKELSHFEKTSENGEAQLALIDTLFTGRDVNEFVKSALL